MGACVQAEVQPFPSSFKSRGVSAAPDALKVGKVDVVAHDIGNMVAYAFAAQARYASPLNKVNFTL
jgi:pimeloyl-ACP methyl ester carboxylesterase